MTPAPPESDRAALRTLVVRAARHGISIGRVLHRTDKALVAEGSWDSLPVIVKTITTDDPYWTGRRSNELALYRAFRVVPPPFAAPRLLLADDWLMILTVIPGVRLHDQRHLPGDIPATAAAGVLDALDAVRGWSPPAGLTEPIADYGGRVDAEHAVGLLDDVDRVTLHRLVDDLGPERWTTHGDPIPTNLLLDGGTCTCVDWELAGRYLPGYDHAVLHTVTATGSPTLAAAIQDRIAGLGIEAAYLLNLGLVLCREIRIHRSLPYGPVRQLRLTALDRLQADWRRRLRDL